MCLGYASSSFVAIEVLLETIRDTGCLLGTFRDALSAEVHLVTGNEMLFLKDAEDGTCSFVDAKLFFVGTKTSFAVMKVIEDVDSDDDSSSVRAVELHLETG